MFVKKMIILVSFSSSFLFSGNMELIEKNNNMQSIINSKVDFNRAVEVVKYKPKKMNDKMKNLYLKYEKGDEFSGFLLAKELYNKKMYTDAGEILSEVITSKNVPPEAFTMLGEMFIHGRGVDKDCLKGGMFYMGGVSAGDCNAFTKMKEQYKNGYCVKVNIDKYRKMDRAEKKCLLDKKNGVVRANKVGNKMIINKR